MAKQDDIRAFPFSELKNIFSIYIKKYVFDKVSRSQLEPMEMIPMGVLSQNPASNMPRSVINASKQQNHIFSCHVPPNGGPKGPPV